MAEAEVTRRLTTIVAVDVAGYSRLMGADETGTLTRLKEHRAVTDPIVEAHGGRIVGTAGDGLLLEFPSVVEAVASAVEVQNIMGERNADLPDDEKMLYRIGINLGDVLADGDDIFGDGVNVAARIEALAEPGGICISRTVRDNVRDRMDIALDDLGEVEVKNIVRPVRVFRVLAEGEAASPVRATFSKRWLAAAMVVVAGVVAGGLWWWQPWVERVAPADPAKMAFALPDKPSIAVLPFDNLSADKEQEYFSDGVTEDIITDLSKISGLFVVARNSTFTYKGKAVKIRQVGEELGVRYVLEGSVRRSEDKIRITAQLIDAATGGHVSYNRILGSGV